MRKSESSRNERPGAKNSFKGNGRDAGKDSKPFKKKFDGDRPSGDRGDRPYKSTKPYQGRVADNDREDKPRGARKSFDNPAFDRDSKPGGRGGAGFKPRRDFDKPGRENNDGEGGERRPRGEFKPRGRESDKPGFERKPRKEFDRPRRDDGERAERRPRKEFDKPRRDDGERAERRPRKEFDKPRRDDGERAERKPRKEFDKPRRDDGERTERKPRKEFDRKGRGDDGGRKPQGDKPRRKFEGERSDKKKDDTRKFRDRPDPFKEGPERKKEPVVISFSKDIDDDTRKEEKPFKAKKFTVPKREEAEAKPMTNKGRKKKYNAGDEEEEEEMQEANTQMPLNKYIAHSGECSRREAADMVKQGKVKVNGELMLDPGYRVQDTDQVTISGKKLTPQRKLVYILLNKPKGFITTNDDPQGRKTVLDLVANSGEERIYPVGRLDRDTTGLLLMTNDGVLTQKLSHPSYNIKKVYHVTLDKPMTKADFEKVVAGVELEDGKAIVDEIAYLEAKNEIGLEIHSGRNRIVRRIFESLGYVVEKLDRVMYAGLTKKNLPRSKWRYLSEREIVLLKHFKN